MANPPCFPISRIPEGWYVEDVDTGERRPGRSYIRQPARVIDALDSLLETFPDRDYRAMNEGDVPVPRSRLECMVTVGRVR